MGTTTTSISIISKPLGAGGDKAIRSKTKKKKKDLGDRKVIQTFSDFYKPLKL